jgi:heterodisulfide reductase subunit C
MSVKENIKVEVKETLRSSSFNSDFPMEIMTHHGGEKLSLCYQCGTCAGSCPSGKLTDMFKIRNLIKMSLLGMREEVLSSDAIWLCASCYTCQERCPQGIEIADLMLAIRNIAVREGYGPKGTIAQGAALLESGRLVKMTSLTEKKRTTYGLPPVPSTGVEAIKKIAKATGFDELIEKLRSEEK